MRVRCVTLNIKGIHDAWLESRFPVLIAGLRRDPPDLLFLQEVALQHQRPTLYHQAREIGAALGLDHVLFSPYGNPTDILPEGEQGGVALVSRWPVREARGRRLPSGHRGISDARTALFARVESPEGPLGTVTTHLSWRPEESEIRLMQLGQILEELNCSAWGTGVDRFVLAGDLNATSDEPCMRATRAQLVDAFEKLHPAELGYTWSSVNSLTKWENLPDRRIDYILCDPSARVLRAEVILDRPEPAYASDHFGVLVELEW